MVQVDVPEVAREENSKSVGGGDSDAVLSSHGARKQKYRQASRFHYATGAAPPAEVAARGLTGSFSKEKYRSGIPSSSSRNSDCSRWCFVPSRSQSGTSLQLALLAFAGFVMHAFSRRSRGHAASSSRR